MNLTQLRKESKKWQKLLGLTQWTIKVQWGTPEDLGWTDTEKVYGLNSYDPNHLTSTITVLHPKHAADSDPYCTLVHELLHLFMFPLESAAGFSIKSPTDQWETLMEQTINKLSDLLIRNHNEQRRNDAGSKPNNRGDEAIRPC